jgi:hypothetical protein
MLYAADAGYKVFAVHGAVLLSGGGAACTCGDPRCPDVGKHPMARGWQRQATRDPGLLRAWSWAAPALNYGIPTWPINPIFVLDADPKSGSAESADDLRSAYGSLPATQQVLTGGGGTHDYFAYPDLPAGKVIRNSVGKPGAPGKLGAGLDVRGLGGFVVGPGSRHHSGTPYCWEGSSGPDVQPLAAPPSWLVDLLVEDERPAASRSGGLTPREQDARFVPADLAQIESCCAFMRYARDHADRLPEPWWHAQLGIVGRCERAVTLARARSAAYPGASDAETDKKLAHAVTAAGPPTCAHIATGLRFPGCGACGWRGLVKSPVQLGRA